MEKLCDIVQTQLPYQVPFRFQVDPSGPIPVQVAKLYGVPVILHTDHCQKSWLPWFDGLIEASGSNDIQLITCWAYPGEMSGVYPNYGHAKMGKQPFCSGQ